MQQVGHLQKLHEKYFDKGLRIIAITAEPTGPVENAVVEKRGGKYWIASDPGRTTMRRYTKQGRLGIPHAYLIDASGKVVSEGVPHESTIESLLKDAFNPALGKELDKALSRAVRSYEKGDYGKAWSQAARELEDDDRKVADDAAYLQKRCAEVADWHKKQVESAIASRDYAMAVADLERIEDAFDDMEVAAWAKQKLEELEKDDKVETELKAWKMYEKAQEKLERAEGDARKMKPAKSIFEGIVKRYPGTRAAELSEKALQSIPSDS